MSRIAAVVGSKSGWFVLRETPLPGPWSWFVAETFEDAMQRLENYEVVAIDAPLSLGEFSEQANDAGEPGIRDRYRRPDLAVTGQRPARRPDRPRRHRRRADRRP